MMPVLLILPYFSTLLFFLSSSLSPSLSAPSFLIAHSVPITAVVFAPVPGITVDEGIRDVGEVVVAGDYQGHIKVYVNSESL